MIGPRVGTGSVQYFSHFGGRMIGPRAETRVWIVAGLTDLRRGFTGLSGLVETGGEEAMHILNGVAARTCIVRTPFE